MARRKTGPASRKMTRKERSRAQREARINRWLVTGAVVVGVLVVGLLIFGYVSETLRGREPVAVVNDVPIRTSDWEMRVRVQRAQMQNQLASYQNQYQQIDPQNPESAYLLQELNQQIQTLQLQLSPEFSDYLEREILDQMIREELFRQEARRRDITVSPVEIDVTIERSFGYDREAASSSILSGAGSDLLPSTGPLTATQSLTSTTGITQTMTEEEFEESYELYRNYVLIPNGMGVDDFRDMIEASLIEQKVQQAIAEEAPETADQVHIRYIATASLEQANELLQRLEQGEMWETIVAQIEAEQGGESYATEMEWRTKRYLEEQFSPELADAAFESPLNEYVGPIEAQNGRYYILEVLGHETRPLEDFMLNYAQSAAIQSWIESQMEGVTYAERFEEEEELELIPQE